MEIRTILEALADWEEYNLLLLKNKSMKAIYQMIIDSAANRFVNIGLYCKMNDL